VTLGLPLVRPVASTGQTGAPLRKDLELNLRDFWSLNYHKDRMEDIELKLIHIWTKHERMKDNLI
jgi:hypothetical protein